MLSTSTSKVFIGKNYEPDFLRVSTTDFFARYLYFFSIKLLISVVFKDKTKYVFLFSEENK